MKQDHCYLNDRIAEVLKPLSGDDKTRVEQIKTFVKFCSQDDMIRHALVHGRLVKPVRIILGEKK